MITEANRYEVVATISRMDRVSVKFSALSLAFQCVCDKHDRASVSRLMEADAYDLHEEFKRLATLLGYTVSKVEMEDAGQ
jgi:hypothetical protein